MWGPTGPVMEMGTGGVYAYGFSPGGDLVARIQGNVNYGNNYDHPRLYGAYGKELWTDEDALSYQPFRWKGQAGYTSDFKTGLVYCWHRYYDPELGRWLTRDPIGLEGGVNTYAYCGGDPVNYVDPSGLTQDWWGGTFYADWSWNRYFGDIWEVLKGEGDALNPVNWVKGIGASVTVFGELGPIDGGKHILQSMWQGLTNFSSPRDAGSSIMGWTLIALPAPKGASALTKLTTKLSSNFKYVKTVTYASKVWEKALKYPIMHNFPMLLNSIIMTRGTRIIDPKRPTYVKYYHEGVVNGKTGVYEIFGYRDAKGNLIVDHRFFRKHKKNGGQ